MKSRQISETEMSEALASAQTEAQASFITTSPQCSVERTTFNAPEAVSKLGFRRISRPTGISLQQSAIYFDHSAAPPEA